MVGYYKNTQSDMDLIMLKIHSIPLKVHIPTLQKPAILVGVSHMTVQDEEAPS